MSAVKLHDKEFGAGFPIIILHGLLGSLDNWQTIAKKLASYYRVFIVDQRNHGKSPHTEEFSYELMADDLVAFMSEHSLSKVHLIGHSMGGKTAMTFALQHPGLVEKLVVVDISPSAFPDRHTFIFNALRAADVAHADTRDEVKKSLMNQLNGDETTVLFLMKGLTRTPDVNGFEWKFNLDVLQKKYPVIAAGIEGYPPYPGQALFLKGEKSDYINPLTTQKIHSLFPKNKLIEIKGAGHWIHAEKPVELLQAVLNFLA